MAWEYDIEKDAFYIEGVEKGIEKGIEQGIEKGIEQGIEKGIEQGMQLKTIRGIQKALTQNILTIEQIALLFEVEVDFVLRVKNGEIQ